MKVLFQGDSVTDAGRDYNDIHNMGLGYPKYASEMISNRHPGTQFEFVNLGIGGNRVSDLYNRLERDFIEINPDVVSVMIGVNDTWHCSYEKCWMSNEEYETYYGNVLHTIKERTHAKILMIEQYLLPVEDKEFFRFDVDAKIQVTRKLARLYADEYIPLDGIFAEHCIHESPLAWSPDGVHPNEAGSRLIAGYYADAFDRIFLSLNK